MVIWIIGKSGSGKSYLAQKIFNKVKLKKKTIWIDGDNFRKKYCKDLGYSIKDRRINSKRIQNFCLKHEKQNKIVICSILSIFPNHQKANRKIFKKYFQIYIKSNLKVLKKRNNKGIYSNIDNVVGKDIKFPKPYKNDLIINNKFNKEILPYISFIIKKII